MFTGDIKISAFDKRHGGGRGAHFALVDEIHEDVPRLGGGGWRLSRCGRSAGTPPASQVRMRPAQSAMAAGGYPVSIASSPFCRRRYKKSPVTSAIAGYLSCSLNTTGVSNLRSSCTNSGTQKLLWRTSTTCRSRWPRNSLGSSARNPSKSAGSKALGRWELPQQRSEAVAEFEHPGVEEMRDGFRRILQFAAVRDPLMTFDRKDEAVRNLRRPFAKRGRRLGAIEGAVDLDRGEAARRVGRLPARAADPWDRIRRAMAQTSNRRCRRGRVWR